MKQRTPWSAIPVAVPVIGSMPDNGQPLSESVGSQPVS
jgi:hypothetical protein